MLRYVIIPLHLLTMASLFSCQPKENQATRGDVQEPRVEMKDTARVSGESANHVAVEAVALAMTIADSAQEAGNDQGNSSGAVIPPQQIEILFPGTFHGNEVNPDAGGWAWLGLFTGDDAVPELRKTQIVAQRVVDGIIDDPQSDEKTGWEVGTSTGEYPIMLIAGIELTEGKVQGVEVPPVVNPGDSVQFDFGKAHYLVYATGTIQPGGSAGVTYVSDYSLYVARNENGVTRKTLLVHHDDFDDAMTSILWSGDLDRDGYIDFLIDMSRHYNSRIPTLFLSKPAGTDEAVVPVAEHASVGC